MQKKFLLNWTSFLKFLKGQLSQNLDVTGHGCVAKHIYRVGIFHSSSFLLHRCDEGLVANHILKCDVMLTEEDDVRQKIM